MIYYHREFFTTPFFNIILQKVYSANLFILGELFINTNRSKNDKLSKNMA